MKIKDYFLVRRLVRQSLSVGGSFNEGGSDGGNEKNQTGINTPAGWRV